MTAYTVPDDRCKQIASAARALWTEFLDLYPQYGSRSLLRSDPENDPKIEEAGRLAQQSFPRNECVEAFFRHCSETMALGPGLVINRVSLKQWVPSVHGYPSSWLVRFEGSTTPHEEDGETTRRREIMPHAIVLVDLDYLVREDPNNLERVWTCLLLHETGHLVLHWDDFAKQCADDGKAMATALQEAEAWLFQSTILGLALGSYAYGCVTIPRRSPGDTHEDAWTYLN